MLWRWHAILRVRAARAPDSGTNSGAWFSGCLNRLDTGYPGPSRRPQGEGPDRSTIRARPWTAAGIVEMWNGASPLGWKPARMEHVFHESNVVTMAFPHHHNA